MEDAARWTLEELVRRAALALADSASSGSYAGAPNGRVRERPDQRVIRWYTSIGLVDRPFGGRGRGSRYGPRHLRQLVAVKRLQAQGLPLAEIQVRLAAVPDDELARLAPLPPAALAPEAAPAPVPASPQRADVRRDLDRFWAVELTDGAVLPEHAVAVEAAAVSAAPAVVPEASPDVGVAPSLRPLTGVQLAPGVLLILPVAPATEDLPALAEAARPLLAALVHRGLVLAAASIAEPTEGVHR